MFRTVLVANRGEIAVRVIRTLRTLGIRSVAVHSDADAAARHVAEADLAIRIGPAPARESYLCIANVVEAAVRSGAEAVHPGYGFLSENAAFARACTEAGLVFVGPGAGAVEIMGDKISAKRVVAAAGVPVVPGRFEPGMTDDDLAAAAAEVGYPVLVKPAAGGGGKGMRLVEAPQELADALASARREALSSFADDTLFIERLVSRPRHIEVQILADSHGQIIHLGERECSLQRRQQKIVEEAPSVLIDPATRQRIGSAAVETARSVGYLGAGTVEFIVSADRPDEFFFLEMNTRLQVEHPVTELVTGLDLVAEQLRIAAGEPLGLTQNEVRLNGHAIEARVYAEDPARGFLPTAGRVLLLREPVGERSEPGVRVDSGLSVGTEVGPWYDPMLSKVIACGPDRPTALARLQHALSRTTVLGVNTNLGFLRTLLADPDVQAGRLDTQFVDRELSRLSGAASMITRNSMIAGGVYGLIRLSRLERAPRSGRDQLWARPSGWRIGGPNPLKFSVQSVRSGQPVQSAEPGGLEPVSVQVRIWSTADATTVSVGEGGPLMPAAVVIGSGAEDGELTLTLDGVTSRWLYALDGDRIWLSRSGETWTLAEAAAPGRTAQVTAKARLAAGITEIRSPMPGVVSAVKIALDDAVESGQALIVVEAMKMEYPVSAARAGRVRELLVKVGDQVSLDQLLATTG